jgi:hypothetical protein
MFALALGTPDPQPDEQFDWDSFYAYTHKNRLEALCAAGAAKLPQMPEPLHKLEQQVNELQYKTIQQIQLLSHLASVLHQAGIRVLSMKGPLLAAELYGNPALRHSNDLDLLVSEADYEAAKEQLLAAGLTEYAGNHPHYEKSKQHNHAMGEDQHEIFVYNNLYVELHWRISFRYPISFEELWENREERMLLGQPVFCLGKTDNLVYLICHAAGHGYSRLRWLIDLYKFFTNSSTNYTELYEQMQKRQAEVFLLETLLMLYRFPSFPMPSISCTYFTIRREGEYVHFTYDKSIDAPALRAYHLTELLEPLVLINQDPRGIAERNYMHMLPVIGRKVTVFSYLYKLIQPKQAELERFHFPDSLYFLYYIVRPFYKLWRCTPFYKGIHK